MPKGVYVRTKPVWNKGLTTDDPRVSANLQKRNTTMIERYGSLSYNNSKKRKCTNIDKYGVENVSQCLDLNKNKVKKLKETNLKRYGCEFSMQNSKVKEKSIETFQKNHIGYTSSSQLPGVGKKISESVKSDDVKEKKRLTFLQKYGVEYGLQNPSILQKKNTTTIQRYGSIHYTNKEKEYKTRKKNNSFIVSKPETTMYLSLCEKYGESNVIRQYREDRYPYCCDFYIVSEDLFIEYNGNWTHGNHPFNTSGQKDILKLQKWKEKEKEHPYYTNAIYTWTVLDVKKRQIAQENNLNYLVIY